MLKKTTEPSIPPNNPFSVDALDRKPCVELLTKLVQSTKQPFVLGLEAPFGFGKTFFLNLWKGHLHKEKHLCLYFNAWENDFVDDPMVAFLGEIEKALTEAGKDPEGFPLAELWKDVKRYGGKIVRKGLPYGVQIATLNVLKAKDVKELASVVTDDGDELAKHAGEFIEKKVAEYDASRKTISGFRKALSDFAEKVAEQEKKRMPIVFFIDELDRCRPDYAIALLERVKHLFQVQGFFFVLGMDRTQLGYSIESLYGQGMDIDGYLRRFVDIRYALPKPKVKQFAEMMYDQLQMDEIFKAMRGNADGKEHLCRITAELAEHFQRSLRVQQQCFTEINMVLRTSDSKTGDEVIPTVFLAFLRAFDSKKYRAIIDGMADPKDIRTLVPQDGWWPPVAEALTILACPVGERRETLAKDLKERANKADRYNDPTGASATMDRFCDFQRVFSVGFRTVIERLEMVSHTRPGN